MIETWLLYDRKTAAQFGAGEEVTAEDFRKSFR